MPAASEPYTCWRKPAGFLCKRNHPAGFSTAATPESPKSARKPTRSLLFLLLLECVIQCSFYMLTPVVGIYATDLGATLSTAGIICGINPFIAMAARPISGYLATIVKEKPLLLITLLVFSICSFSSAETANVPLYASLRAVQGACFSIQSTLILLLVSSCSPPNRIGQSVGWLGASIGVASAIGPALGLFIAEQQGCESSLVASGSLSLLAMLLVPLLPKSNQRAKEACSSARRKRGSVVDSLFCPAAIPFSLVSAAFSMCTSCISGFLALAAADRNISFAVVYFMIYSALLLLVRPFGGRISDSQPLSRIVAVSAVACAAAMILLASARSFAPIAIAGVLMAFGYGMASPSLQAACLKSDPEGNLGTASSTSFIGTDLGNALGPIIAGLAVQGLGYDVAFSLEALFPIAAGIVCSRISRHEH